MKDDRDTFEFSSRPATPEWFVTFADMMSLLLALFVMIASFSEVKELQRFRAMSDSLRGQFGHSEKRDSAVDENIQARDAQLAAAINPARARRAALLQVNLPAAIAGKNATAATFVTRGGDQPAGVRRN